MKLAKIKGPYISGGLKTGFQRKIRLVLRITGVAEEICAFLGGEVIEGFADGGPKSIDGPFCRFSHQRFELGKHHFKIGLKPGE